MIIVEGGDNVGKSTLVRQLIELDPKLRLLKRDRYKPGHGETIATSYVEALIPSDGDLLVHSHALADRLIASECIYGQLFRGGCRMSKAEHFILRMILLAYKTIVVLCDPGDEVIQRTWEEREQTHDGKNPIPLEDGFKIIETYREEVPKIFSGLRIIRYNWTSPNAEQERLRIISEHLVEQEMNQRVLSKLSTFPGGMGEPLDPKLIFIGQFPFGSGMFDSHTPEDNFFVSMLDRAIDEVVGKSSLKHQMYFTGSTRDPEKNGAALREELNFVMDNFKNVIVTLGPDCKNAFERLRTTIPNPRAVFHVPNPITWKLMDDPAVSLGSTFKSIVKATHRSSP